ncbi:MAG: DUF4179 domain-containing protein [Clostridiales bacterium]|nr:DUF4179 domain-containing protein [Clostridiales bacterium]
MKLDFHTAFPQVPEHVHMRLEKALEEKETMNGKKARRPAAALALALALLLGLMGIAYAAVHAGILDYLVGGEEQASQGLIDSIQPVAATAAADDIRIDLTGAVFDGDRLALSFTMENERPEDIALVTLDTVTLNGQWIPIDFQSFLDQWLPEVFSMNEPGYVRNPISGGMLSDWIDQDFSGILQGEATFVVSRPVKQLAVVDPWMWYDLDQVIPEAAWRQDYQNRKEAVLGSGAIIADAFTMEAGYWLSQGYTPVNISGRFLLETAEHRHLIPFYAGEGYGERALYTNVTNRSGQMMESARITLPFTIDADAAKSIRIEPMLSDIALSNCTVHFEKVLATPLSTLIHMKLYPLENTEEAADELMRCYPSPSLVSPEGQAIDWLNMEGMGWGSGPSSDEEQKYYEIGISWGGMAEIPDALHFSFEYADEAADEHIQKLRQEFMEKVVIPLR